MIYRLRRAFCPILLSVLLLCQLCLSSCENADIRTIFALDTTIDLDFEAPADEKKALLSGCVALIREQEQCLSKTIAGSAVSAFNASASGLAEAPGALCDLISLGCEVSRATGGAFDLTLGKLISLWNIGGNPDTVPGEQEITEALSHCGYEKITLTGDAVRSLTKSDPELTVDLGGIAKGYIAQKTVTYLKTNGALRGVLQFGGNLATFGEKTDETPWRIGLRDPQNTERTVGYVELRGENYVSVSGGYERYITVGGQTYHHILSGHTGYPAASGLLSAAVIASDGALADALSTALFVMGRDAAMQLYESGTFAFEAVLVGESGEIYTTPGITGQFHKNESVTHAN